MGIDNMLYLSGEIGLNKNTKQVYPHFETQVRAMMNRIKDTLQKSGKGITLKNVVKASVAMRRLDKHYETFNRIYKEFFSEPYPVRSVFEVSGQTYNKQKKSICSKSNHTVKKNHFEMKLTSSS